VKAVHPLAGSLMIAGDDDGDAVITQAPDRPNQVTQSEMHASSSDLPVERQAMAHHSPPFSTTESTHEARRPCPTDQPRCQAVR